MATTLQRLAAAAAMPLLATALAVSAAMPAHAESPIFYTVRAGLLDHDTKLANGIEKGVDINGELQFQSPVPKSLVAGLPGWIRWLALPRPTLGAEINTSGYTSQGYATLTWTPLRFERLFNDGDAISVDLGFGPALNDGYTNTSRRFHKSLGTNILFRTSLEIGYEVTPQLGVYALYEHSSNAGLAAHNPGINDVGLRVGFKF